MILPLFAGFFPSSPYPEFLTFTASLDILTDSCHGTVFAPARNMYIFIPSSAVYICGYLLSIVIIYDQDIFLLQLCTNVLYVV